MGDITPRAAALREALEGAKPVTLPTGGMLTVAEACQYLRISKWTLYRLIQGNKIKTVKIGSRRLIRMQTIVEFIDQLEAMLG
jgi:excisionase family DNA binding protein